MQLYAKIMVHPHAPSPFWMNSKDDAMSKYSKSSKVPLKAQYKICYSYVREIVVIGEYLHYDECAGAKINGILKSRYAALKWHIELQFHPALIQACEAHYSQSKRDTDKYHGGAWMDKHRENDNSKATFTRNNKINKYQRGIYSREFDDIPF